MYSECSYLECATVSTVTFPMWNVLPVLSWLECAAGRSVCVCLYLEATRWELVMAWPEVQHKKHQDRTGRFKKTMIQDFKFFLLSCLYHWWHIYFPAWYICTKYQITRVICLLLLNMKHLVKGFFSLIRSRVAFSTKKLLLYQKVGKSVWYV